jgi:hypothetical protein
MKATHDEIECLTETTAMLSALIGDAEGVDVYPAEGDEGDLRVQLPRLLEELPSDAVCELNHFMRHVEGLLAFFYRTEAMLDRLNP